MPLRRRLAPHGVPGGQQSLWRVDRDGTGEGQLMSELRTVTCACGASAELDLPWGVVSAMCPACTAKWLRVPGEVPAESWVLVPMPATFSPGDEGPRTPVEVERVWSDETGVMIQGSIPGTGPSGGLDEFSMEQPRFASGGVLGHRPDGDSVPVMLSPGSRLPREVIEQIGSINPIAMSELPKIERLFGPETTAEQCLEMGARANFMAERTALEQRVRANLADAVRAVMQSAAPVGVDLDRDDYEVLAVAAVEVFVEFLRTPPAIQYKPMDL